MLSFSGIAAAFLVAACGGHTERNTPADNADGQPSDAGASGAGGAGAGDAGAAGMGGAVTVPGYCEALGGLSAESVRRLSRLLWKTEPSDSDVERITQSQLRDDLLGDPRFAASMSGFGDFWFGRTGARDLTKDPELFPELDQNGAEDVRGETRRVLEYLFTGGRVTVHDLLNTRVSFALPGVAPLYGLPRGERPQPDVPFTFGQIRAGLLTRAHFLTAFSSYSWSSPTYRGMFIFEKLFCGPELPDPGLPETNPLVDPEQVNQAYWVSMFSNENCKHCHELYGSGLGFEVYDAIGRYRTTQGTEPIQTGFTLHRAIPNEPSETVSDIHAMFDLLGDDAEVLDCQIMTWLGFLLGRQPSTLQAVRGVLVPDPANGCAPRYPIETMPEATFERFIRDIEQNARICTPEGERPSLNDIVFELARSSEVSSCTFECGNQRCFASSEYCVVSFDDATCRASDLRYGVPSCENPPYDGRGCACETSEEGGTRFVCGL